MKIKIISIFILVLSMLGEATGQSSSAQFELYNGTVRLKNLKQDLTNDLALRSQKDLSTLFRVFTWDAHVKGLQQPVAGNYELKEGMLIFSPLFPFAEGEKYVAQFTSNAVTVNEKSIQFTFTIPKPVYSLTSVDVVYPEADTLPENLLRMYIHFSSPMRTGEGYQHIKLIDEKGDIVERAFLLVDQELWDTAHQRFTLLFDPGRIKRGIKSNLELGLPLKYGNTYTLIIDSLWRDAHGNPLKNNFKKTVIVGRAERKKLSTINWKIISPQPGSKNPLFVQFDKPLDHALASKNISVMHSSLGAIYGNIVLNGNDRLWEFTPEYPWNPGTYTLEILPYLEDVAGNNFNNVFDVDLSKENRINSIDPVKLPFSIKPLVK